MGSYVGFLRFVRVFLRIAKQLATVLICKNYYNLYIILYQY